MPTVGNPNLARVVFARRNVQPPTTLYVGNDDHLTVTCLYSDTDFDPPFIHVRLLTAYGQVQHMTYRMAARIPSAGFDLQRFPLREGQLLGVEVRPGAGVVSRGDCFAMVELTQSLGAVPQEHAILCADYTTHFQRTGWPQGRIISPDEGPGHERLFTLAAPPAGQVPSTAVPSVSRWQLKMIQAQVQTSPTVGPRLARILVTDGAQSVYLAHSAIEAPPTTIMAYMFTQAPSAFGPLAGFRVEQIPLPPGLWIRRNWTVQVDLAGIQPGDQFSTSTWLVEEALSG